MEDRKYVSSSSYATGRNGGQEIREFAILRYWQEWRTVNTLDCHAGKIEIKEVRHKTGSLGNMKNKHTYSNGRKGRQEKRPSLYCQERKKEESATLIRYCTGRKCYKCRIERSPPLY
jgi:hypothetical protein